MAEEIHNIKLKTIKGAKWSYLTTISTRLVQPVISIILARLLIPDDFGIYGMALVVVSFLNMFLDAGLGKALIQRNKDVERAQNVVFYNNLILSILWYIIIYLSAPVIALYFKRGEVTDVLRIIGLSFLIYPLLYTQKNILTKELEFKKLFYLNLAPTILSGVISVCMALLGFGIWSLVNGYLSGLLLTAILSWRLVSWRPKWEYDFRISKEMLGFGGYATLEVILGWLMTSVDNIFVGRFLGASKLGIYRMGYNLAIMPHNLITVPLNQVLYPAFCKMNNDKEALKRYYLKSIELISLVSFPFGVLIFFTAPYFVPLLLGQKWAETIPVIQLIIVNGVLASIVTMNPEIYRAIGRPDIMVKFFTVRVAFSLPAYYLASQYGIVELCYAHVGLTLTFVPVNMFICSRMLRWKLLDMFNVIKIPVFISILSITTGVLYKYFALEISPLNAHYLLNLLGTISIFFITFCSFLFIFSKNKASEIMSIVMQSLRG